MTNSNLLLRILPLLAVLTIGCNGGSGSDAVTDAGLADAGASDASTDLSEELFRPDHILEVNITMAAEDWSTLRKQPDAIGLPKSTCGDQPVEKPYSYFPGEITIDGTTISNVGIRKKGSFGSLSEQRPGLKIKPSEYVQGQRIFGLTRITLNNNHQDDSLISQCLGYDLFRSAGIPAPRCSFAHVIVNGEDLGVYSHIESIKKSFLRRHFSDDSGNLYESGGEFLPGQTNGFQPKVNKNAPDCSDLSPVVSALQSNDTEFPAALESVVDTDAFMTYWAMEVLTDHWDGYSNNRNNYFFYHDPSSDQFHFIPWGMDALFAGRTRSTRPDSVFACGSIPWRLYDVPATKTLYLDTLRDVIASVWDETAILAEVDRMEQLLTSIADPNNSGDFAQNIQNVRDFVSTRKSILLGELDAGAPVWPYPAGTDSCLINLGTVSATFDTTWDTLEDFSVGSGTMSGTIGGVAIDSSSVFSGAGINVAESQTVIRLFSELPDNTLAVVYIIIHDPANLTVGTQPIDLVTIAAVLTFYDPATDSSYGGGLILNGSLTLTSAGTGVDAPIVGSMTGDVFEL